MKVAWTRVPRRSFVVWSLTASPASLFIKPISYSVFLQSNEFHVVSHTSRPVMKPCLLGHFPDYLFLTLAWIINSLSDLSLAVASNWKTFTVPPKLRQFVQIMLFSYFHCKILITVLKRSLYYASSPIDWKHLYLTESISKSET